MSSSDRSIVVWSGKDGQMYVVYSGAKKGKAVADFDSAVDHAIATFGHGFQIHYALDEDIPDSMWPKGKQASSAKKTKKVDVSGLLGDKPQKKTRQKKSPVLEDKSASDSDDPFFG